MDKSIKKGDIINVHTESVANDYKRNRDYASVEVEVRPSDDEFRSITKLGGRQIFKVVEKDVHEDIAKYGVKIHQFVLEGEKIKHISFPKEGVVKVNGEYELEEGDRSKKPLSETWFFDERTAQDIATALNIEERECMKELSGSLEKAIVMFNRIIEDRKV